ncbi:hypothetical protein AB6A40_005208 [Gnathostoma spinigerum]|uniref:Uncharacterized protein n=1 Tax=Gnathostoma spinigerum TaxID=75299 RepID=A0ABD6EMF3_9BILA
MLQIVGHRLLSPPIDPDLVVLVRHRERPQYRRETHDYIGQLPIPLDDEDKRIAVQSDAIQLPKKYPRGIRYS